MFFGKLYITKDAFGLEFRQEMFVLDAEPQVMVLARKLLVGQNFVTNGQFTHRVFYCPVNKSNAKDFAWLSQRYPLESEKWVQIEDLTKQYDKVISDYKQAKDDYSNPFENTQLIPAIELKNHQKSFVNFANKVERILLADSLGLGKTYSSLGTIANPEARPALIICPPHLCLQWEKEVKKFYPELKTHVIKNLKNLDIPVADVVITAYSRVANGLDPLKNYNFKSMICDEIHDLRHLGTAKRDAVKSLSESAKKFIGLSGTPIFNYGSEIWSIMDLIKPGLLGEYNHFLYEWCVDYRLKEPVLMNKFLSNEGALMRRTPQELKMDFNTATRNIITLEADLKSLHDLKNVMKSLALSILSLDLKEMNEAAKEFDFKLRMATGVAKAKAVAHFVKMMVEQGEKVLLAGWHRDCYDIYLKELAQYNPVMFTGTETPKQKDQAVKTFQENDDCKVFIISLRSGAGVDGLQYASRVCVFGELDWSPHVMDQVLGRVDRYGQTSPVQAFYLTVQDGSDPVMMQILSAKRSQHAGLIEGKEEASEIVEPNNSEKIVEMARSYLTSIGEEVPEQVVNTGIIQDVANALKSFKVLVKDEAELQDFIWKHLPGLLSQYKVEREVKIGARARLDFLVSSDTDRVAVEVKINASKRADVYRQVKKYLEHEKINNLVLFAPWNGISSFTVNDTKVVVVDYTKNAI